MPLVELYYDPERLDSVRAQALAIRLPQIVAKHLSVWQRDDGRLTPKDIEVRVRPKAQHFDVTSYALEITIWAMHFPERESLLPITTPRIAEDVQKLGYTGGFVYILLAPAGFSEF